MIEKKTAISLLEGYAIALKHYLRGEHGIYYEDLYHLVCYLPKYAIPSSIPHPGEGVDLGRRATRHGTYKPELTDSVEHLDYEKSTSATTSRPSAERQPSTAEMLRDQEHSHTTSSIRPLHDPLRPARPLQAAYLPPEKDIWDTLPVLTIFRSLWKVLRSSPTRIRELNGPLAGDSQFVWS